MAQARMEKDEAIKIRVERLEMAGLVEGVIVFDIGGYFHLMTNSIFHNGAKRVSRCSLW